MPSCTSSGTRRARVWLSCASTEAQDLALFIHPLIRGTLLGAGTLCNLIEPSGTAEHVPSLMDMRWAMWVQVSWVPSQLGSNPRSWSHPFLDQRRKRSPGGPGKALGSVQPPALTAGGSGPEETIGGSREMRTEPWRPPSLLSRLLGQGLAGWGPCQSLGGGAERPGASSVTRGVRHTSSQKRNQRQQPLLFLMFSH